MFCYIYGDFFGLFVHGRLQDMIAGQFGPLGATTPAILVGVSCMMAVPALMIAGSLVLPAAMCRWANIVLGIAYAGIMLVSMPGAPPFYLVLGVAEIILSGAIVVCAWRWPRAPT